MKTLHLTLKKKWFDMIFSGEKKEEYREIKDYWLKRLCFNDPVRIHECIAYNTDYKIVEFKNGYSKDARKFQIELLEITTGKANPKWGYDLGETVFIIKLGNIIQ